MDDSRTFDSMAKSLYAAIEIFSNAVEQLHNDKIYKKIVDQQNASISYEDVEGYFLEFGILEPRGAIEFLLSSEKSLEEYEYMRGIVASDKISMRDKLVLLLGYLEAFVYKRLKIPSNAGIKNDVEKLVDKTNKINLEDSKMLTVYGIVCVIYKRFDKQGIVIDKRIPHRNYVLHNGTLDFDDKEIESAYFMLVLFIYIINEYTR